jgi:hypothetical protein
MKLSYSVILVTIVLTFSQASAKTQGEANNNQPKIVSGAESPSLKVGESFLVARRRIVRSGWRPTRMHANDQYEYSGAEKELADHQFLEVDSCSMDAGALCILHYSKGTRCLRVDTVGEQLKDMKVTRWTDECPVDRP